MNTQTKKRPTYAVSWRHTAGGRERHGDEIRRSAHWRKSRRDGHFPPRPRDRASVRAGRLPADSCRRTSSRMAFRSQSSSARSRSANRSASSRSSWKRLSSRRRCLAMERPRHARAIRAPKDLGVPDAAVAMSALPLLGGGLEYVGATPLDRRRNSAREPVVYALNAAGRRIQSEFLGQGGGTAESQNDLAIGVQPRALLSHRRN